MNIVLSGAARQLTQEYETRIQNKETRNKIKTLHKQRHC